MDRNGHPQSPLLQNTLRLSLVTVLLKRSKGLESLLKLHMGVGREQTQGKVFFSPRYVPYAFCELFHVTITNHPKEIY